MLERKAGIEGRPIRPPEPREYVCCDCSLPCAIIILTPAHMTEITPTRCIFAHNQLPANWTFNGLRALPRSIEEEYC